MVYGMGKKRWNLIFTAYLLLATACVFSLVITEPLFNKDVRSAAHNDTNSLKKPSLDWHSCEAISVTKVRGFSSSPLRNGTLRTFTPAEINDVSVYFCESYYKAAVSNYMPDKKNTILLKLRI